MNKNHINNQKYKCTRLHASPPQDFYIEHWRCMIFADLASGHSGPGWIHELDFEFWQKPSQIRTGNYAAGKGDLIFWPVVPSSSCIIHSLSPEPP